MDMHCSETPDLFGGAHIVGGGQAHARRDDLETSVEAAEAIAPHIRQIRLAVLRYAEGCGRTGFTDVALNAHFDTHSSTYRSRRRELVDLGMVEDSGGRVVLQGSGRRHAVWRITARGSGALLDQ